MKIEEEFYDVAFEAFKRDDYHMSEYHCVTVAIDTFLDNWLTAERLVAAFDKWNGADPSGVTEVYVDMRSGNTIVVDGMIDFDGIVKALKEQQ